MRLLHGTTYNVIRAKIAADFRSGVVPHLMAGDPIKLPGGDVVTYGSHSTNYRGRHDASINVTAYPIETRSLGEKEPLPIPKSFLCSWLGCNVPVNVRVTERPKIEPEPYYPRYPRIRGYDPSFERW